MGDRKGDIFNILLKLALGNMFPLHYTICNNFLKILSAMYDKDSAIYALSLRLKINVLKRIFAERRHLEADHLLAYRCIAQRVCYVDPGCFVVHDQLRLFIEPGTFGLVWRQPG